MERVQQSVQFLQFQVQVKEDELREMAEQIEFLEGQHSRNAESEADRLAEYEQLLEEANAKIEKLMAEDEAKERAIGELRQKLNDASMDESTVNGGFEENDGIELQNSLEQELENLRIEVAKLKQKLLNATEEKDYYKRHFKGEQNGGEQAGEDWVEGINFEWK